MPKGANRTEVTPAVKPKLDPVAKQRAIVKRATEALDKAQKAAEAAGAKLAGANRKVKLAQRELDYQQSHPDLEGETEEAPKYDPSTVSDDFDPMEDEAPAWPGDAPPKDPLA